MDAAACRSCDVPAAADEHRSSGPRAGAARPATSCASMKDSPTMLARNGAWSLLNQVVRVGSLALVIIALGRHFGPQRFGSLAVGLALVRIFAVVASFGLDRVIVRRLVDEEERGSAITREGFWLKLAIAFVSYLAMLALILIFQPNDNLLFAVAALAGGGLLFQACDVFD